MIGYVDSRNEASLRLHEHCGFARVGYLPAVDFKYGARSDSVTVQRTLGGRRGRAARDVALTLGSLYSS